MEAKFTRLSDPLFESEPRTTTSDMSSAPPPSEPPSNEKPLISVDVQETTRSNPDAMEVTPEPPAETWEDLPPELLSASAEEISSRMRLIDNEIRVSRFASHSRAVGGGE